MYKSIDKTLEMNSLDISEIVEIDSRGFAGDRQHYSMNNHLIDVSMWTSM